MYIVPISKISTLADLNKETAAVSSATGAMPFQSLYEEAINNVKETEANVNNEYLKLATGQSDDLHNIIIASNKATLSLQLLVEIRNKALESYNEIMRMNV